MIKKLSIIVPIFNTSKYLIECLNSILSQVVEDIEIICINDGSTDNSADIIKDFKSNNSRIKYFEQSNQGLSTARNRGIIESQSKYIMFIDSDDYIYENCIKLSLETAEKKGADIVLFNSTREEINKVHDKNIKIESNDKNEILKSVLSFEIKTSTCFGIFKKDLIIKQKLFFPPNRLYEDASILYKLIHTSERVIKIRNILYFYRKRNNSITSSINIKTIDDIFLSLNEVIVYLQENNLNCHKKLVNGRLCALINGIIQNISNTSNKEELFYHLISNLVNYENKSGIPIEIKISWLIYLLNIADLTKSQIFENLFYNDLEEKYFKKIKNFSYNFDNIFRSQNRLLQKSPFYFYGKNSTTMYYLETEKTIYDFKGFINSKFSFDIGEGQNSILLSSVDFTESFSIFINSVSSAFIIKDQILNHRGYHKDKHSIFTFYDLLVLNS